MNEAWTWYQVILLFLIATPFVFLPNYLQYRKEKKIKDEQNYWDFIKKTRHRIIDRGKIL